MRCFAQSIIQKLLRSSGWKAKSFGLIQLYSKLEVKISELVYIQCGNWSTSETLSNTKIIAEGNTEISLIRMTRFNELYQSGQFNIIKRQQVIHYIKSIGNLRIWVNGTFFNIGTLLGNWNNILIS